MNKIKKCAGKEAYERMNYLYQIGNFFACRDEYLSNLSIEYLNLMRNVSQKTVQRIDIDIKRSICKQCNTAQIPGSTARIRVKKKQIKYICRNCNKTKTFNVRNSKYLPWTLTEDAIVETIDYKLSND